MPGLTDIEGIKVGHASDFEALTGCTAILCERGAVAGCDIGGAATGTQEFDLLSPFHLTERIHAVIFAGGSAFGLEAACGVRRYLEQKGVGYDTGAAKVPLVPCAILYDLGIGKPSVRPTREMGEAAAAAASVKPVEEGCVGAGTGATVGKILGMKNAMKGGIGTMTVALEGPYAGVLVSALAAVNAFGDVRDPESGKIIAGARTASGFADTESLLKRGRRGGFQNTTLVAVATNARLTKVQASRVARMAQAGVLRTLRPGHTMFDGDIVIALSLGEREADVNSLGVAAAEAVARSIVRGVRLARGMGGVPGLAK
jgi:L-aminopeptidase/D-esterase-like protein